MATFHINRGGTNLGTFSEEDVRAGLQSGRFLGTDLGWREGMATWLALAQCPEFAGVTAPAAAPIPPPQFAPGSTTGAAASVVPRSGLPWDERQQRGILRAFFDTMILVLTRPGEAFTAMKREGGFPADEAVKQAVRTHLQGSELKDTTSRQVSLQGSESSATCSGR